MEKKPEIGEWEKHTKGIGMKLLQKFGFKGRLGAKENGVSQSIEVVVRPTNSGLGFGDTKEAAALLVNKKIEAEWRGLEFNEEDFLPVKKKSKSKIEQLASSQQWKKNSTSTGSTQSSLSSSSYDGSATMTASEFIAKRLGSSASARESAGKQTIIDMRYGNARVLTDLADINSEGLPSAASDPNFKPLLGQEFLYNVNLITDLHEGETLKQASALKATQERARGFRDDEEQLKVLLNDNEARLSKLQKLNAVLDRVNSKMDESSVSLSSVCGLIETLYESFIDEFYEFGIINVLPSLLSKKIMEDGWDPLSDPGYIVEVYETYISLPNFFDSLGQKALAGQTMNIFHAVMKEKFLPPIRRAISNNWSVHSPEKCVRLLEAVGLVFHASVFDDLVNMFIIPRLTSAVDNWKPIVNSPSTAPTPTDTKTNGADAALKSTVNVDSLPVHLWLHPWIPVLKSRLSTMYPDIRRKMAHCLNRWQPPNPSALLLIKPWVDVFDKTSLESLVLRSIVPKLAFSLREQFVIDPASQDLTEFNCLISWQPIISPAHFVCLLAGEVLPKWVRILVNWLSADTGCDFEEVSAWYAGWKEQIPKEVASDPLILSTFDLALDLMQAFMMREEESAESAQAILNAPQFQSRLKVLEKQSYYSLVEAKKTVAMTLNRLSDIKKDMHVLSRTKAGAQPLKVVFKEVVESFAELNGIAFAPKVGKMHDGAQVWTFGSALVYMDQNVLFVQQPESKKWVPMSLEELIVFAQ